MVGNSTNLSLLGVIKWLLIIGSIAPLMKAFQGIVQQKTATGYGQSGAASTQLMEGGEAVKFGFVNLGIAVVMLAVAWALWFFWQQYED